ncbi:hypothetical protein XBP1_1080021 [Xenorhabdus bovienii str. puntauvense]|uniref:Uncharacterized protein n=2 Tax=Xenorhabdus bovienii TaxID=40576 RepID=A0A077NA76_XENBV|nr:hypothetical protein XBP1_1080021 [Xenorhabdus bovienii str. puntauvense]CDH02534.1 hypothetical protein XBFM1_2730005 [Xenorhabdus bovienii str. feltiae Moldova]
MAALKLPLKNRHKKSNTNGVGSDRLLKVSRPHLGNDNELLSEGQLHFSIHMKISYYVRFYFYNRT